SAPYGWPRLWNRIFDWRHTERNVKLAYLETKTDAKEEIKNRFTASGVKDIGGSFRNGTNLESKTAALISLAFVFFIGYWLIAGPGAYLFLAAKRRTHLSWFVFGCTAVVATLLTVAVTRIVLRGSAQIRHLSLVRMRADTEQPARVLSQFGIYLPQDRPDAPVTLTHRSEEGQTTLTPLVSHPAFNGSNTTPRDSSYTVSLPSDDTGEAVTLAVPFRSTLKKLQADWTGQFNHPTSATPSNITGRISGKPILLTQSNAPIGGQLSNNTGSRLTDVIMLYRYPAQVDLLNGQVRTLDRLLYMKVWENGQTIDLSDIHTRANNKLDEDGGLRLREDLKRGEWINLVNGFYINKLRTEIMANNIAFDDSNNGFGTSFVVASLFDMLPPMVNEPDRQGRSEIMRIGVRQWDVSGAVAAGGMVILAQTERAPCPLPLTVDGAPPEGTGHTFWQMILPMDRSQIDLFKLAKEDQ
ncbi:MAG TPA: hypothetical protein VGB55_04095, partial [Tepidisphaeraceae bacterium]